MAGAERKPKEKKGENAVQKAQTGAWTLLDTLKPKLPYVLEGDIIITATLEAWTVPGHLDTTLS